MLKCFSYPETTEVHGMQEGAVWEEETKASLSLTFQIQNSGFCI